MKVVAGTGFEPVWLGLTSRHPMKVRLLEPATINLEIGGSRLPLATQSAH
jgi:hypothetical protein